MQAPTHNWEEDSKSNRKRGVIVSVSVHALLAILFLLFGLSRPYPPPPEEGVLINFGTAEQGSGDVQPETEQQPVEEQVAESVESEEIEDAPQETAEPENIPDPTQQEVATQETEEAPAIEEEKEEEEEQPTEEPEEQPEEEPKEEQKPQKQEQEQQQEEEPQPEPQEEQKQEVNEDALFPGAESEQNKQSEGEGDDALFEGDKGQEDGEKEKGAYEGDESKGKGDSGIGFALDGRSLEKAPDVQDKSQKTGKVVLEIKVDQNGNVLSADYTLKGSTTQDSYLIKLAKEAAREAKFNTSPNAPEEQWGKMSFTFRVR